MLLLNWGREDRIYVTVLQRVPSNSLQTIQVSTGAPSRSDAEKATLAMLKKEQQSGISKQFISPDNSQLSPLCRIYRDGF